MSGREDTQNRDARLAEALRENLRRRKAQARSRREQEPAEPPEIDEGQAAKDGPRD